MSRLTDEQVQMEIEFRERYGESACADLHRELLELRAVVAKLPKTADGVPVVPGDKVHYAETGPRGGLYYQELIAGTDEHAGRWWWDDDTNSMGREWEPVRLIAKGYSTKEAAIAAAGETP
jgi:hypothetical protein